MALGLTSLKNATTEQEVSHFASKVCYIEGEA